MLLFFLQYFWVALSPEKKKKITPGISRDDIILIVSPIGQINADFCFCFDPIMGQR